MYKSILVPLDGSPTSLRGLQEAIGLARVHHARLRLLHVVDDYPLLVQAWAAGDAFDQVRAIWREQGQALLDKARTQVDAAGVPCDVVLLEVGSYRVAQAVVTEAADAGCDLIVMGTHGRRGVDRLLLGSDAEAVLKTSTVPVLLLRAEASDDAKSGNATAA
jgi:nucleotide-binding universal stress UspA family protein